MGDYLKANWNGRMNGNSPLSFIGVAETGQEDRDKLKIYELNRGISLPETDQPSRPMR